MDTEHHLQGKMRTFTCVFAFMICAHIRISVCCVTRRAPAYPGWGGADQRPPYGAPYGAPPPAQASPPQQGGAPPQASLSYPGYQAPTQGTYYPPQNAVGNDYSAAPPPSATSEQQQQQETQPQEQAQDQTQASTAQVGEVQPTQPVAPESTKKKASKIRLIYNNNDTSPVSRLPYRLSE